MVLDIQKDVHDDRHLVTHNSDKLAFVVVAFQVKKKHQNYPKVLANPPQKSGLAIPFLSESSSYT